MKPRRGAFGRDEAAHLLRRAAFAPAPGEVDRAVAEGMEGTIARLLGGPEPAPQPEADAVEAELRGSDDREVLAGALLLRLGTTTEPLREQIVLFLHNHFVSALSKVQEGRMMLDQVALFRRKGPGPFLELASAVARDPAMVRYLDSEKSTRSHPNENFARELLELFTMGPGPYTERDIQEAARAFTGWHLDGGRFRYSEAAHDDGVKQVLGTEGRLGGDDVVRLAVEHAGTPRFMAGKLARAFVTDEPSGSLVDGIAALWRDEHGHLGRVLSALFASEAFFAPEHRHALTRSPAALVGALLRGLGVRRAPVELARRVQAMGQTLLDPPSVEGYPGGASWLNPATLLARRALLLEVADASAAATAGLDDDGLALHVLGRSLDGEARRRWLEALEATPEAGRAGRRLGLLLCHPDYQRC